MKTTQETKSNQSELVDENKILSVVKRLFNGTVREVIGELLQNAQRAGAKTVWIETSGDGRITVRDNGTGLASPGNFNAAGDIVLYSEDEYIKNMFAPLMQIAASAYERESVAEQDPMGVGLFSLFALEEVSRVQIKSGGYSLEIDTTRLWTEPGYWQRWRQFISKEKQNNLQTGVELVITATADLSSKIESELTRRGFSGDPTNESPASGYEGILEIFLNSTPLDTSCPRALKMDERFVETVYFGNRLIIGADNYASVNTVNWFGQLIPAGASGLRFYLEVRANRPLNPLSPSRRGIIKDSAWEKFQDFMKLEIRKYILNTPREEISALAVKTAYHFDKVWADENCPYLTASQLIHDENATSFQEWQWQEKKPVVLTYEENPVLLDDTVHIFKENMSADKNVGADEETKFECAFGAISFVPVIEEAVGEKVYELRAGNAGRLNVHRLWWKPGAELENFFARNGEFQLTSGEGENLDKPAQPDENKWRAIGEHTVFAFEMEENWNIEAAESLIVGVADSLKNKIEFLNTAAWCIWSYENDDSNGDQMEAEYRLNLEELKATLFGDSLPDETLDLWKLRSYFGLDAGEAITNLEFSYAEEKTSALQPTGVALRTDKNRLITRRFVSSLESDLTAIARQ